MTFDDGPVPEATEYVLKVLKENNVKATFFCIGDNIQKHPDIFKKVKSDGHSIGNHTFNHLDGWNTPNKEYFDNISKCNELTKSLLFRPPYGRLTFSQYRKVNKEFDVIMWDLVGYDFLEDLNVDESLKMISKRTEEGSIMVFHDSMKALANIKVLLPKYIEYCKVNNFEFGVL